jgi:hypothetical protein
VATYNGEVLFRTSRLSAGGTAQQDQQGHQSDVGFKVASSLFPESPFPFYVQAMRVTNGSSGDLAPGSAIRSGLVAPVGTPPVDVSTLNTGLGVGGQLTVGNLPRVQLSYRTSAATITGGSYLAEQQTSDLSADVSKDTRLTRQTLRFQQSAFDSLLGQQFTQRLSNLDYDFEATLGSHARLVARAGRRTTFSQSTIAGGVVDANGAPYQPPPSIGDGGAQYTSSTLSYDPSIRLAVRMTASYDWQTAAHVTTGARLGTLTSHYEIVRGLSLNGTAIAGDRQQIVGASQVTVSSRTGIGGISYQGGPRWASLSASTTRGVGSSATPDGRTGTTDSWTHEAGLSSSIRWLGLGIGYERARYVDEILDFGNYSTERVRASAQAQAERLSLSTSVDRARIDRGQADTFTSNLQRTASMAASYRTWRESQLTATAGGFVNDYTTPTGPGRDTSVYWTLGGQFPARDTLRLSGWIRSERVDSTRTLFNQDGLSSFGRAEYRFRETSLALEYRRNSSQIQYVALPSPDNFVGRQLRISLSRQFGIRR